MSHFQSMSHNKTFKLPSKDDISFLHPQSQKYKIQNSKNGSQPIKNKEFGHFERKVAKVSPPPKSEPFDDVYESEIEVREDPSMDDSGCQINRRVDESMQEINELIETISQNVVNSFEAQKGSGKFQCEGFDFQTKFQWSPKSLAEQNSETKSIRD